MPRPLRALRGGFVYHVINRGNARMRVFHDSTDYAQFVELLRSAGEYVAMRILAYCLMPNHFHLVLWPYGDDDTGRWMRWLMTTHVRRHHVRHETAGRIWQGRFRAFPIEQDHHLLNVLRYVERNALTANLVDRAEEWRWSSLPLRTSRAQLLADGPTDVPADWPEWVNAPMTEKELEALRASARTGRPYGSDPWVARAAIELDLESTLKPRGRPRKKGSDPFF